MRLNTLRYFFSISGPLPQTIEDFWRMIHLTKAELIVMTTMIVEEGKVCILELISPVPHDSIQTVTRVSRDLLLRVVPPSMKGR